MANLGQNTTAERVLAAYAEDGCESWRDDHMSAISCHRLEEKLQFGIGLFRAITAIADRRLNDPECAEEPSEIENYFKWWLKPCDRITARIVEFEKLFKDGVEGADDFRRCCEQAKVFLQSTPILLAGEQRAGYRDVVLSAEAAQVVKSMLQDPFCSTGRLAYEATEVPLADPSLLKRAQ